MKKKHFRLIIKYVLKTDCNLYSFNMKIEITARNFFSRAVPSIHTFFGKIQQAKQFNSGKQCSSLFCFPPCLSSNIETILFCTLRSNAKIRYIIIPNLAEAKPLRKLFAVQKHLYPLVSKTIVEFIICRVNVLTN